MTERDWYRQAVARLQKAGCDDAGFDARCLWEDAVGGRGRQPGDATLSEDATAWLETALSRREQGYPLQYLLSEWDFLSLTLQVGEGVLIPRPDTEILCETAASYAVRYGGGRWLDLCAGSGCVGLGLASLCPSVTVTAVEYSLDALPYLQENAKRYPSFSVEVKQADVLTDALLFPDEWDGIVSNPPYIPTGDLASLQREVQFEPAMALDGDADGLRFYRAIAEQWIPKLRSGGVCAVEVGFDQAPAVEDLWRQAGLHRIRRIKDLAGIERVVVGEK